jgi:hypothetical protein
MIGWIFSNSETIFARKVLRDEDFLVCPHFGKNDFQRKAAGKFRPLI